MGIPEEDLGPRWLRDYDSLYNIGGDVRVNVPALEEFAAALRTNLEADYVPHAQRVFEDMTRPVSPPNPGFAELTAALQAHRDVQQATTDNVANHGNGTSAFASAAQTIGQNYQRADEYSAARVEDVQANLGVTPAPGATGPTTPAPGTSPAAPVTDPAGGA